MIITKKKFCDTGPFCTTWKGWTGGPVDAREQHDAFEFFNIFLSQYDEEIQSIFRGSIRNTIESVDGSFQRHVCEPFYGIDLDVKGYRNVEESLNVFTHSETFSGKNQYKIDDGRYIDAKKDVRIESAPPVLVLQLKRFEYDLTSWERYKVDDRLEFPSS